MEGPGCEGAGWSGCTDPVQHQKATRLSICRPHVLSPPPSLPPSPSPTTRTPTFTAARRCACLASASQVGGRAATPRRSRVPVLPALLTRRPAAALRQQPTAPPSWPWLLVRRHGAACGDGVAALAGAGAAAGELAGAGRAAGARVQGRGARCGSRCRCMPARGLLRHGEGALLAWAAGTRCRGSRRGSSPPATPLTSPHPPPPPTFSPSPTQIFEATLTFREAYPSGSTDFHKSLALYRSGEGGRGGAVAAIPLRVGGRGGAGGWRKEPCVWGGLFRAGEGGGWGASKP